MEAYVYKSPFNFKKEHLIKMAQSFNLYGETLADYLMYYSINYKSGD